jgi:hypothetical protein
MTSAQPSMLIPFLYVLLSYRLTFCTGLFLLGRLCYSVTPCPASFSPFSRIASRLVTPPYALLIPFLSPSFPSYSYWLYHLLLALALTHILTQPSSYWLVTMSYFEIVFSVVFNFFKLYGQFATF